MLVLIAPTKTQKEVHTDKKLSEPLFISHTGKIINHIQTFDYETLKRNMKVSDKIATEVHRNYQSISHSNPAVLTYQGSSFKQMNPELWDAHYVQDHLVILSALYGMLRPYDAIAFYRLDFLMKIDFDLYAYWQDTITKALNDRGKPILNLASLEYARMIDKDQLSVPFYTLDFKEIIDNKPVSKSTYAKIARGKMVDYILNHKVNTLDTLKTIVIDEYRYDEKLSSSTTLIFSR